MNATEKESAAWPIAIATIVVSAIVAAVFLRKSRSPSAAGTIHTYSIQGAVLL